MGVEGELAREVLDPSTQLGGPCVVDPAGDERLLRVLLEPRCAQSLLSRWFVMVAERSWDPESAGVRLGILPRLGPVQISGTAAGNQGLGEPEPGIEPGFFAPLPVQCNLCRSLTRPQLPDTPSATAPRAARTPNLSHLGGVGHITAHPREGSSAMTLPRQIQIGLVVAGEQFLQRVEEPAVVVAGGTEVPVAISGGRVRGPEGERAGTVFVIRDMRRERELGRLGTRLGARGTRKEWVAGALGVGSDRVSVRATTTVGIVRSIATPPDASPRRSDRFSEVSSGTRPNTINREHVRRRIAQGVAGARLRGQIVEVERGGGGHGRGLKGRKGERAKRARGREGEGEGDLAWEKGGGRRA